MPVLEPFQYQCRVGVVENITVNCKVGPPT